MHVVVPIKDSTRDYTVRVNSPENFGSARVQLASNRRDVSLLLLNLAYFSRTALEKYVTEQRLVGELMGKISSQQSVCGRWLPTFALGLHTIERILNLEDRVDFMDNDFKIDSQIMLPVRTLGQWFVALLTERVQRSRGSGVSLRTLLYAIAWCTRLIDDNDLVTLRQSAIPIRAWLLQDTCDDCLYKVLKELKPVYVGRYSLAAADTFSAFVRIPDLRHAVSVGPCEDPHLDLVKTLENNSGVFLKTFGRHSFLTSPYARVAVNVEVKVDAIASPQSHKMSGREATTLLIVLDLHARVLQASDWGHSLTAFSSWVRERRLDQGETREKILSQIITDLHCLAGRSAALETTVSHFIMLLTKGHLSREMLNAYSARKRERRVSSQEFIVEYAFLRAATPDLGAFAKKFLSGFVAGDDAIKAQMLSMELPAEYAGYDYLSNPVNLLDAWNVRIDVEEEDLLSYDGTSMNFERNQADARSISPAPRESEEEVPATIDIHKALERLGVRVPDAEPYPDLDEDKMDFAGAVTHDASALPVAAVHLMDPELQVMMEGANSSALMDDFKSANQSTNDTNDKSPQSISIDDKSDIHVPDAPLAGADD